MTQESPSEAKFDLKLAPGELRLLRDIAMAATDDGVAVSCLSWLRQSEPASSKGAISKPAICILLQGAKVVTTGSRLLKIEAGEAIFICTVLPIVDRVAEATGERPFVALKVELDTAALLALAVQVQVTGQDESYPACISRWRFRPQVTEVLIRLVQLIQRPDDVAVLAPRFGCVLADAGYGLSAPFRQGLTERGLAWAVGIPRHLKVYPVDVKLIWPITKVRGKPRKHHVPDILSIAAEQMLASAKWKAVSWRSGTKGRLKARFAALRVRTADGPPQRIWDKGQQHLPGDEAWLIGEQRASGEKKYYLANLPAATDLRTLAATIKARWICEQAHQQLKEELGLDHFEGRSWQGLHRHALMTMIAYAFLQHRRLAHAGRKKKNQRTSASANHARRTSRHRRPHPSAAVSAVPILPKTNP
jgi:hypothetical protein